MKSVLTTAFTLLVLFAGTSSVYAMEKFDPASCDQEALLAQKQRSHKAELGISEIALDADPIPPGFPVSTGPDDGFENESGGNLYALTFKMFPKDHIWAAWYALYFDSNCEVYAEGEIPKPTDN